MKKYQIIGTTDDVNTCDCCGRTNLKKTVILKDTESSEEVYFGTECAAKALNWTIKEVNKLAKAETERIQKEIRYQIYIHPLMQKQNEEIKEFNRIKAPFEERAKRFKEWNEWQKIAEQEVKARYPKVS